MGKIVYNKHAADATSAKNLFDGSYGGGEIVICNEPSLPEVFVYAGSPKSISDPENIVFRKTPDTGMTGTIVSADTLNDVAAKINTFYNTTTASTSKVDNIIVGVGLATDGTYTASTGAVYITGATSVQDALEKLNAAIISEKANAIATAKTYTDNAIAGLDSTTATTNNSYYITGITMANGKISSIAQEKVNITETNITSTTSAAHISTATSVLASVTLSGTKNHTLTFTAADKIYSAGTADSSLSATTATSATTSYSAVNTTTLSGYTPGNAAGQIPVSNGTLNTNLNADKLDGYTTGHAEGNIPVSDKSLCNGLNADMLDGKHTGHTADSIPVSDGSLCAGLNAEKVSGYTPGNASGNIPVSNGTLNTNLNADKLDGKDIDELLTNFSNTTSTVGTAGETQVVVGGVTVKCSVNADKLDGYDSGNASGNIPVSNGTLNTNLNADMVDGYHFVVGSTGSTLNTIYFL